MLLGKIAFLLFLNWFIHIASESDIDINVIQINFRFISIAAQNIMRIYDPFLSLFVFSLSLGIQQPSAWCRSGEMSVHQFASKHSPQFESDLKAILIEL